MLSSWFWSNILSHILRFSSCRNQISRLIFRIRFYQIENHLLFLELPPFKIMPKTGLMKQMNEKL